MKEKEEKTLEFDKFRKLLVDKAGSVLGKELAEKLRPAEDFDDALRLLDETEEEFILLQSGAMPPIGGMRDIRKQLEKVKRGAFLDMEELLLVRDSMFVMRAVKKYFKEIEQDVPILKSWAHDIELLGQLERRLENTVDENGTIRDEATIELARIRKSIRKTERDVKTQLSATLHNPSYQKFFQDSIVTIRDDRYVIPVKQEYRYAFPGIIHDQSATGATLFIEPMAIVNLNNDLKQLTLEEKQEIERILRRISQEIGKVSSELSQNMQILGRMDFTIAKAKLAVDMNGTRPKLNKSGLTDIKQARHPLISKDTVVPVNIALGGEYSMLLVTGPNTGGKTVSMKTLGLLALMAKSGCFIPAEIDSDVAFYENIYADIGDEQSIEQSLSTFSSHIRHIVDILEKAESGDLILLDELGAGTDPEEGAALAMSILEALHERNISVVATTHYSELKTFAYTHDGIENACVEFDLKTLRPTYRLLTGIPGASNAFAISRRLGLSKALILRAQELIREDHAQFEHVVDALEKEKILYEQRNEEIRERQEHARKLEEKLRKMREELSEKKTQILKQARSEGNTIIRRAKRESEEIIQELKDQFNDYGVKKRQSTIQNARGRLSELSDSVRPEFKTSTIYKERIDTEKLEIGDIVFVTALNEKGRVISKKGKSIEVDFGNMTTKVSADSCRFVSRAEKSPAEKGSMKNGARELLQKAQNVRREIDIRGMMVDEGEQCVGKFIDDAELAGLKDILVIHGKGTGALRKGIHEYLKRHKSVKNFIFADIDEGGSGATVVYLK